MAENERIWDYPGWSPVLRKLLNAKRNKKDIIMCNINRYKTRLFALKRLLRHDFEQMRDLNDVSERFLKRELKHFVSRIEKEAEGMPDDKKEYLHGWHADTHWQLSVIFPKLQRASLFVFTIGLLETRLNKICEFLSKTNPQNAMTLSNFEDKGDKGIDRAMLFMKKICGISIDRSTKTWKHWGQPRK